MGVRGRNKEGLDRSVFFDIIHTLTSGVRDEFADMGIVLALK